MTEHENDRLDELFEMVQENNHVLRGMRRDARLSKLFRLIKWVALVVLGYFAYLQIMPYLQAISDLQNNTSDLQLEFNESLDNVRGLF